jgi:hypothetical protein
MQFFQWNVLSQAFCTNKEYSEEFYDSEIFDMDRRHNSILNTISQAINDDRIIVLHEVDHVLRGKLATLSDKSNYFFLSQGHGFFRNWYMGSVIMFPRTVYSLIESDFIHIGGMIATEINPPENEKPSWFWSIVNDCLIRNHTKSSEPTSNYDLYQKAVRAPNILLHVFLKPHDKFLKPFHVWAYHMPCAFNYPSVMEYHTRQVINCIDPVNQNEHEHEHEHFLCMDGNFLPDSQPYRIFQESGFRSVFALTDAGEPEWTCSSNSNYGGPFSGTTDYIWVFSDSVRISVLVELPEISEKSLNLPTLTFPSDHLWMKLDII